MRVTLSACGVPPQEYHSLNSCSTPCENTAQCIGNGLDYNGLHNPVLNQFNMPACSMGPDFGNGERSTTVSGTAGTADWLSASALHECPGRPAGRAWLNCCAAL